MTLRKFLHAILLIIIFLAVLGLIALYQVNKISSHEWRWHKQLTGFVEQQSTTPSKREG